MKFSLAGLQSIWVNLSARWVPMLGGVSRGQGMIEYGLLVALIGVVAVVTLNNLGTAQIHNFQKVVNAL